MLISNFIINYFVQLLKSKFLIRLPLAGLFIYLGMFSTSCNSSTNQQQEARDITDPAIHEITGEGSASTNLPLNDSSVTFKIFTNDAASGLSGFGYDIYIDEKRYVHQPQMPAVAGNKGFNTETAASKTAAFVCFKIQHNIMPPSVTVEELDSLGVK